MRNLTPNQAALPSELASSRLIFGSKPVGETTKRQPPRRLSDFGFPKTDLAESPRQLIVPKLPISLSLETIQLHALANRIEPFCSQAKMLAMITLLILVCSGCVRRRMTVRTSPPGATVSIDNQLIGTSPASTDFIYYGTREVRVEREGYRTEVVLRRMKPPWYQLPVLDFVSETLWPGEIRDERIIDIELVPQVIEPSEDVLNRAEALRNQSRSGIIPAG